ncbi:SEC-C domain-containing protein [Actinomycetospora endophytica]|uniref:SEC-C domain-containing protein n=1 Tax=Actinomycetospora endophytica TaxID=2291215 RepID=A0ABS8PI57_9PSEU|nr:SEC-C domain-containing protein [Actinomycetospora endophytica]MCD2197907.1 SEC-C domain-containing protein [Actinomycetospora endophytica]
MATLLTEDDLTEITHDAIVADDPGPAIDTLLAVVDEGRLADEADRTYALGLAADLAEKRRDGDQAIALSRRSVTAAQGTDEENWTRGRHADLLLRFGHDDEGMREARALRHLLTRDEMAALYVTEALTENGRAELAEEWLTTALATAVDIVERAETGSTAREEAEEIEYALATKRRAVRRDLGLPPDEIDQEMDELEGDSPEPEMLFWPEAAFDQMLATFPDRAESLGATWEEHRMYVEQVLLEVGPMPVEVATPELLTATLEGEDVEAVASGPLLEWPPGRNDPCWCGSRTKYKKCCLPRTRS